VRFGGISGDVMLSVSNTTNITNKTHCDIWNAGATNSQKSNTGQSSGGWGAASAALNTGTQDTTAAVSLVISGQLANSGDDMTLAYYDVFLYPG
jgi:hypothetical protein